MASPISPQIPATLIKTRPSVRLSPVGCAVTTAPEPALDACGATPGPKAAVGACGVAFGADPVVDACGATLGAEAVADVRGVALGPKAAVDACGVALGPEPVVDDLEAGAIGAVPADAFSRREPHHGHESYKSR